MVTTSESIDEFRQASRTGAVRALVVDDDHEVRHVLSAVLESQGLEVGQAESIARAYTLFGEQLWDLIYLDKCLPDGDGLTFLDYVVKQETGAKVIMITGQGSANEAMLALNIGAVDYLPKPFDSDIILRQLFKFILQGTSPRDLRKPLPYVEPGLVGRSASMVEVAKEVHRVAPLDCRVLITGESGTGKEVVAREIFLKSRRSHLPFITVNCGAINKELIESELFGHEKGAFTGAHTGRTGLFQEADGGTIFLDEITETPLDFQVKLLRVLQEGEFRKVGSNRVVKIDVRVLAASNRDLQSQIEAGTFRTDLYYRLNQSHIHLLPLRQRVDDIPKLVDHFVALEAQKSGREIPSVHNSVYELLYRYDWPGNVRELEHAIAAAFTRCDGVIRISDLPDRIQELALREVVTGDPLLVGKAQLHLPLEEIERQHICAVLASTNGNRSEAAEILGISKRTLERKLADMNLRHAQLTETLLAMKSRLEGE